MRDAKRAVRRRSPGKMRAGVCIVVLLGLCFWMTLEVEGLTISLNGQTIPNNNVSRISVYDFEIISRDDDFTSALRCQSELTTADGVTDITNGCLVGDGDGPITCDHPSPSRIHVSGESIRGWRASRINNDDGHRVLYLTRRTENPEEGYYNCHMSGDINPLSGLYILYPITAVTAAIEVVAGTPTFRVRCTSTGGRALNMAVTGPGYSSDLTRNIQPKGNRSFLGNDNYTSTTEVISSGKAGDVYRCNVTSIESRTENITVEVASAPVLNSLVQINPTTVRVMWTASPAVSVTGYRVHYSLSGKHQNVTDIKNSTSREMTGLTNGRTYTLSVEVISSNSLPAVSEEMSITLGPDSPEGVVAAAEAASVRVSWQAVNTADRYTVTFSQVQGDDQQGLCPTDSHVASLTVSAPLNTVNVLVGVDVESTVTDMLRAYTTYEVVVKAASDDLGISPASETRIVTTPQTGSGEAPGNVRAEAQSSTEISLSWSGLSDCRLLNGLVIGYRVKIKTCCTSETRNKEVDDGEDWRSEGEIFLTGLTSFTNYSIAVAAVNENGDIGLYSDPVAATTHQLSCSSDNVCSSSSTGVIVGVLMGLIGVAVGVSGVISGVVIAKRHSTYIPEPKNKSDNTRTEINPVYGMSGLDKKTEEIEGFGDYEVVQSKSEEDSEEGSYI